MSYADFITLLFAFFTVLYATSQADLDKQKEFEEEIIRLNATLEEKVKQRTTELARKNEELINEITERVKAEELIKQQLQEKEVLWQRQLL